MGCPIYNQILGLNSNWNELWAKLQFLAADIARLTVFCIQIIPCLEILQILFIPLNIFCEQTQAEGLLKVTCFHSFDQFNEICFGSFLCMSYKSRADD